eukprot:scaffold1690_cov366-Prasinococcus_capsulatus_cf.AAC.6
MCLVAEALVDYQSPVCAMLSWIVGGEGSELGKGDAIAAARQPWGRNGQRSLLVLHEVVIVQLDSYVTRRSAARRQCP